MLVPDLNGELTLPDIEESQSTELNALKERPDSQKWWLYKVTTKSNWRQELQKEFSNQEDFWSDFDSRLSKSSDKNMDLATEKAIRLVMQFRDTKDVSCFKTMKCAWFCFAIECNLNMSFVDMVQRLKHWLPALLGITLVFKDFVLQRLVSFLYLTAPVVYIQHSRSHRLLDIFRQIDYRDIRMSFPTDDDARFSALEKVQSTGKGISLLRMAEFFAQCKCLRSVYNQFSSIFQPNEVSAKLDKDDAMVLQMLSTSFVLQNIIPNLGSTILPGDEDGITGSSIGKFNYVRSIYESDSAHDF